MIYGIRVYFKPTRFDDAFYESHVQKNDTFSKTRACRINWIRATLENDEAELYFGWNRHTGIDKKRRVCVVYDNFVVVIELKLTQNGIIKGEFKTAYLADNSIDKIRSGARWSREEFENIHGISR